MNFEKILTLSQYELPPDFRVANMVYLNYIRNPIKEAFMYYSEGDYNCLVKQIQQKVAMY